jgi:hypothetical protein
MTDISSRNSIKNLDRYRIRTLTCLIRSRDTIQNTTIHDTFYDSTSMVQIDIFVNSCSANYCICPQALLNYLLILLLFSLPRAALILGRSMHLLMHLLERYTYICICTHYCIQERRNTGFFANPFFCCLC